MPSSATSVLRADWKASSASAWRPQRYSATICCARKRSCSGCRATSASSSATSSTSRPHARSASIARSNASGVTRPNAPRRSAHTARRRDPRAPARATAPAQRGTPRRDAKAPLGQRPRTRRSPGARRPPSPARRRRPRRRSRARESRSSSRPRGLAQLRHVGLQHVSRGDRRIVAPDLIHQPRDRHDLVRVHEQDRQQARWRGPPMRAGTPPTSASSGPRTRNSSPTPGETSSSQALAPSLLGSPAGSVTRTRPTDEGVLFYGRVTTAEGPGPLVALRSTSGAEPMRYGGVRDKLRQEPDGVRLCTGSGRLWWRGRSEQVGKRSPWSACSRRCSRSSPCGFYGCGTTARAGRQPPRVSTHRHGPV